MSFFYRLIKNSQRNPNVFFHKVGWQRNSIRRYNLTQWNKTRLALSQHDVRNHTQAAPTAFWFMADFLKLQCARSLLQTTFSPISGSEWIPSARTAQFSLHLSCTWKNKLLSIAYFHPPLHCCCMISVCYCSENECHVSNSFSPQWEKKYKRKEEKEPRVYALYPVHTQSCIPAFLFFPNRDLYTKFPGLAFKWVFVRIRNAMPNRKSFYFIMQEITYFKGCKVDDQIFREHPHSFILVFILPDEVSEN